MKTQQIKILADEERKKHVALIRGNYGTVKNKE